MEHTYVKQAKRIGVALAAVAAVSALGIGTAQAQEFVRPDISVNSVGFLECAFKETGLTPGESVTHTCGATDVGWLTQCFIRNKPVANIPPELHVAHDVTTEQTREASQRGTITAAILTAYPTVEEEFGEPLCPEAEGVEITEEITAIRWCNASLEDTTNGVVGATEAETFLQMERNGAGNIPGCDELATLDTDI
jgi:hypothetical protein